MINANYPLYMYCASHTHNINIVDYLKNHFVLYTFGVRQYRNISIGDDTSVFYYSKSTFQKAGLSEENSEYATVGAGVVNFFMAIFSIYLMSRFNRRTTFQLSALCSIICLIILGIAITHINVISWMPYLSIFGVMAYVCAYGVGLGPIPYFIGTELFEVGPRPVAMALGSMANWGGNFTIAMVFPILQDKIGATSFYIFAVLTFMQFIFIRFYLALYSFVNSSVCCKNASLCSVVALILLKFSTLRPSIISSSLSIRIISESSSR
ncbi:hypothetical protein Trydic_g20258 [Trypoxylus dichotomus]